MKKFTVLGYYEESFQTFAHHVEAQNASQAFFKVACDFPDANFIVALNGFHQEDVSLTFPGEGVVDAETVLEQEDIFTITSTRGTSMDKPLNMISQLRRRVAENGQATITVDEFNQLQAEWITRANIIVSEENPVYDLQFKDGKPVTHPGT